MAKGGGASSGVGSKGIEAALGMYSPTIRPRNMMFRQLASALQTGGGKGFKMPFVQGAVARSRAIGQQALAGAREDLGGLDANLRGRILNRMSRQQQQTTAGIGPRVAAEMIQQAPALIANTGAAAVPALGVGAAGEEAAARAAAIRAQGFSQLASGIASGVGSAAGAFGGGAGGGAAGASGALAQGAGTTAGAAPATSTWFDKFRLGGA